MLKSDLSLADLPDIAAARFGDREALVFEQRRYTFEQLASEIERAAKALLSCGVGAGDHVALWLNNRDDWVFISFALLKIGAVQVPLNPRFRSRDLAYVLAQSDSTVLITHDISGPIDYLSIAREVVDLPLDGVSVEDAKFPHLRRVIIVGREPHSGTVDWVGALAEGAQISDQTLAARHASVCADDLAFIKYTSGTTGFPKGVMHTHRLLRNIELRAHRMAVTERDVVLNYLPLFHAFGFSEGMLMPIIAGAKQVVVETFSAPHCLDLIARERATVIHGFEAHVKDLSEAQELEPRDLSSLRTGLFAAGMRSATPVIRKSLTALAPIRPISGYGMTEVWLGAGIGALDDSESQRTESSGYPGIDYELRIVDPDTGLVLPDGETGELQIRGRYLMRGYYNKPQETAQCFTADGWFKTGDSAFIRDDGYLRFLGRYKDMLKVGGENVDPMEAEGLLLEHPQIQQVAVVALPDERLSEIPVAFVQRTPNADLNEERVLDYCRGKLASFKLPRHALFVDEFPMTSSGKIRKVDLREEAKRRLRPASNE